MPGFNSLIGHGSGGRFDSGHFHSWECGVTGCAHCNCLGSSVEEHSLDMREAEGSIPSLDTTQNYPGPPRLHVLRAPEGSGVYSTGATAKEAPVGEHRPRNADVAGFDSRLWLCPCRSNWRQGLAGLAHLVQSTPLVWERCRVQNSGSARSVANPRPLQAQRADSCRSSQR